ncbi:MAG: 2-C-methyl-D-erythritol 4-phosphate cytidylyltransferase [Chitinophagaceae bacterium]
MDKYAIILAAGKGQRMNNPTPKQFITLYKKPIWYYSVKTFLDTFSTINIIIPILPNSIGKVQQDIKKYFSTSSQKIQVVAGGEMRFFSVKNALSYIDKNKKSIIFIHDSARCLIDSELLKKLYIATQKYDSAIPLLSVTDSIRQFEQGILYKAVDREHIFSVQTPQVFSSDILLASFRAEYKPHFTDDASVVEYAGYQLHFIEGDRSNIKITHPIDIEIAKLYLKNKKLC